MLRAARYFFGFGGSEFEVVDSPIQPGGSLAGKDSSEASSTGSIAGSGLGELGFTLRPFGGALCFSVGSDMAES
jgi:hypothetical protein